MRGFTVIELIVILIIGGVLAMLFGVGPRLTYGRAAVEVEQLRSDMSTMDLISEDIEGQATEWNQRIVRGRYHNSIPVVGWFIFACRRRWFISCPSTAAAETKA